MRIAVPVDGGVLAGHFGHCERFVMVDAGDEDRQVTGVSEVEAPEHQPGRLPGWLEERGVTVVIAGGMGARAQGLLEALGVTVVLGAKSGPGEELARAYLAGRLETGSFECNHDQHQH